MRKDGEEMGRKAFVWPENAGASSVEWPDNNLRSCHGRQRRTRQTGYIYFHIRIAYNNNLLFYTDYAASNPPY